MYQWKLIKQDQNKHQIKKSNQMVNETLTKTKWAIDPAHSEIAFKVKHLMISNVKGSFTEFDGTVYADDNTFTEAEITVNVNTASVNTSDEKRDGHLKSADFFDAENFKTATFTSTLLKKKSDGDFELTGNLTLKGITKPVTLNVEFGGMMKDPWGNEKVGFTVTGKINRKDWGLNWNAALEAGGVLVSDDVHINADIQLMKSA
jgi:polyisoprenoid-binding protein YceI